MTLTTDTRRSVFSALDFDVNSKWKTILFSAGSMTILSLHIQKEKSLVLATKDRILEYQKNGTWEEIAVAPTDSGFLQYFVGKTVNYAISKNKVYQMLPETSQWTEIVGSSQVDAGTIDGDTFWGIDDKGTLGKYTPNSNVWMQGELPAIKHWNPNKSVGMAASGNYFWLGLRDRANDLFKIDKNPVAKGAIWQITADNLPFYQKDITEKIGLLNSQGQPFGPLGQICISTDNLLYASTEQGVWQRSSLEPTWKQIWSNFGNVALFPLNDNSILTYNRKTKEILLFKHQSWYRLPKISFDIKSACLLDGVLYVSGNNIVSSIPVNVAKPVEPANPKMATYLNIGRVSSAARLGNNIYLISSVNNELFQMECDTYKMTKVGSVNSPVFDMSGSDDNLFIATKAGLFRYNSSQQQLTQLLSISIAPQNTRVDSDGSLIAYLVDKTIRVLDSNYTVLHEINISADYVLDIAIKNGHLYVVGFRNEKNNRVPVQSAFLNCYQIGDTVKQLWQTWGFLGAELGNDMADTRIYKVVATETEVIILGESAGGNTVYRWNGKDLSTPTLAVSDTYNNPFNSKSPHLAYYAVVDAKTGLVKRGQFSIPRTNSVGANTNRVRTLAYDDNSLYVGSFAASKIDNRDYIKFLGKKPPNYSNGDAGLLKVSADFEAREFWFTPGNGQVVLFDSKVTVISVYAGTPEMPITANGKNRQSGEDAFVIIW
jgi:hypothetical protein